MLRERIHLESVVFQSVVWVLAMVRCVVGAGARARILFARALIPSSSAQRRAVLSTIDKSSASSIHRRRPATARRTKRSPKHRLARRRRRHVATYNRLNDVAPVATDMNPTTRALPPCSTDRTSRLPRIAWRALRLRSRTASVSDIHDAAHIHAHMHATCAHAHMHLQPWSARCARDLMRANPSVHR
jgi:hypothetical protein